MKISVDELVENSFVISVNEERLRFFLEQWRSAGLPGAPRHVRGLQLGLSHMYTDMMKCDIQTKTHISAMSTHMMIISMARAMGLPFACVFEDDAVGREDVRLSLPAALEAAPDDADVLILGNCRLFGVRRDLGNGFVEPTRSFGMQSYVCARKNYDYFLDHIKSDFHTGLTGYGRNVYLAKDILFCQYSRYPETNQRWNKANSGFLYDAKSALDRDEVLKGFRLFLPGEFERAPDAGEKARSEPVPAKPGRKAGAGPRRRTRIPL